MIIRSACTISEHRLANGFVLFCARQNYSFWLGLLFFCYEQRFRVRRLTFPFFAYLVDEYPGAFDNSGFHTKQHALKAGHCLHYRRYWVLDFLSIFLHIGILRVSIPLSHNLMNLRSLSKSCKA